jgi:aquaporin Z
MSPCRALIITLLAAAGVDAACSDGSCLGMEVMEDISAVSLLQTAMEVSRHTSTGGSKQAPSNAAQTVNMVKQQVEKAKEDIVKQAVKEEKAAIEHQKDVEEALENAAEDIKEEAVEKKSDAGKIVIAAKADIAAQAERLKDAVTEATQDEEALDPNATPTQTEEKGAIRAMGTAGIIGVVALTACLGSGIIYMQAKGSAEDSNLVQRCIGEFIGTFMLIFAVGCNVLVGDKTWGVLSIAATLMVSIYALAGVSGAHLNPSVTIAVCMIKKIEFSEAIAYICAQLAAAVIAAVSFIRLLDGDFALGPSEGYSIAQAGWAELLYTFMLVFVVLNSAASKIHGGKDQFYGLAIAFTVVAGGYGAGSISGGCFNPAVALGVALGKTALYYPAYAFFEILGSIMAVSLFRLCRPEDIPGAAETGDEEHPFISKVASEFIGTFILVLTVGLNVLGSSPAGALSIAAALLSMIYALGSVSGAHFNPAVTAAILASGRGLITTGTAAVYMCTQVLGGIAAAFTYAYLENGKTVPLAPKKDGALVGELIFTFLLCFVVLCVATVKQSSAHSQTFGLSIGFCVVAGGYSIGSLSGGSLNPAVSAGLAVSDCFMSKGPIANLFSYAAIEFMGGVIAAAAFYATHKDEYKSDDDEKMVK